MTEERRLKYNAYMRAWNAQHPGYTSRQQREARLNNPSHFKSYRAAYQLKNRDRINLGRRTHNAVRRARKASGDIFDCSKKVSLLKLERFCQWCCNRLTPQNFSIDHIIAIARGGRHHPDNLAACCASCNSSKCDKLLADWLPTLRKAA